MFQRAQPRTHAASLYPKQLTSTAAHCVRACVLAPAAAPAAAVAAVAASPHAVH